MLAVRESLFQQSEKEPQLQKDRRNPINRLGVILVGFVSVKTAKSLSKQPQNPSENLFSV